MSFSFGSFVPSNYLAPANPLVLLNVSNQYAYLRLINNSPYQLSVNLTGVPIIVSEFWMKDIPVPPYFQQTVTITPIINISTVPHAQSNSLTIEAYYASEITSPVDMSMQQQAVTTTASGKPLFTATVGFGATTTTIQNLNIFNPSNSGVTFTFHSIRVFTNDNTAPTANLFYVSGGDKNLSGAVAAVSHNGIATPPVSFAHCTSQDGSAGYTGNPIIEVLDMPASLTQDMLDFPDSYTLSPGGNLAIVLTSGASGHVVRLTMKWSEDIAVPPQGGVLTGVVMTSIVNQGNPSPTPVVTSSPSGDGATATLINNNGTATLGDSLHAGNLQVSDGTNGASLFATQLQITQGISTATLVSTALIFPTNALRAGSGAPAAGLGSNGDYYFRSDTPGTANQRIYVKSAGAWVGIL